MQVKAGISSTWPGPRALSGKKGRRYESLAVGFLLLLWVGPRTSVQTEKALAPTGTHDDSAVFCGFC